MTGLGAAWVRVKSVGYRKPGNIRKSMQIHKPVVYKFFFMPFHFFWSNEFTTNCIFFNFIFLIQIDPAYCTYIVYSPEIEKFTKPPGILTTVDKDETTVPFDNHLVI